MALSSFLKTGALALLVLSCGGDGRSSAPVPLQEGGGAAPIVEAARPIAGTDLDYRDLLAAAGPARRILLGESTHGTHEYYRERARLSERLIREQGVNAIAIEGDWTPTQRVNL